jgi:catalase
MRIHASNSQKLGDLREARPSCPHSPDSADASASYPENVDGAKVQAGSESFADHFGQAASFWSSMADWEEIKASGSRSSRQTV